jgi:hypothetical protein
MVMMKNKLAFLILVAFSFYAHAETKDSKKPIMKFLGAYDAGVSNASIIKLFDPTDEVLCYVLMPDNTSRRQVDKDKWVYEANSVGSISCLKVRVPVIPLTPNSTVQNEYKK